MPNSDQRELPRLVTCSECGYLASGTHLNKSLLIILLLHVPPQLRDGDFSGTVLVDFFEGLEECIHGWGRRRRSKDFKS